VRTIGGKKILFVNDMWGTDLRIYRFNAATDGEIAIPCGHIDNSQIWYDSNGNGERESSENISAPLPGGNGGISYDVASNGDIWNSHNGGGKSGVRQLIFQGIDANGVPKWNNTNKNYWDSSELQPFGELQRAIYLPDQDVLYVTGYATSLDPTHHWQGVAWGAKWIGSVVARYDNWSKGNRTASWVKIIPDYNAGSPISIAVAGDFIFIGYAYFGSHGKESTIRALNKSDGNNFGAPFRVGPEVSSSSGTMDILYGITAHKRPNGEYIILAEEDWHAKVIMYRWKPDGVVVNTPPTVSITAPANNATFTAGSNITITANASDADGTVTKVEFYQGTNKLGEDLTSPYSFTWNAVAAGSYSITAKAIDNSSGTTTSTAVSITVNPAANTLPTVSITAPANNATFTAGSNITITADASDADGTVTKVEFYQGTNKLE
jgi:hypothetical protein